MRKLKITVKQRSNVFHKRGTINRIVIKKNVNKFTTLLVP
jgi:hypothetical protein